VGVGLLCGSADALDGRAIIHRLQSRFAEVKSLSARFERRHFWKLVDQTRVIRGRLMVERPNRFRFESKVQTVVTDGETIWNYDPASEQVVVTHYEASQDDRSHEKLLFDLILLGKHSDRYQPHYSGQENVGRRSCHVVELRATQDETYLSQIRLWVDRKEWLVRRAEYTNINEDVTTYTLSDLKRNKNIKPEVFAFTLPREVEVVDLR